MKIRTIAKILGGAVALILAGLLVAPLFISADYLKTQLVEQVKKSTGRDLKIEGKTTLSLFPTLAVHAENVTLGNPAGFKSEYFAHIGALEVGAALQPLLNGDLHITGITLDGAVLNLESLADGRKNWQFTLAKKKTSSSKKTGEAATAPSVLVGDVHISKSAVHYQAAGKKSIDVEDLNIKLSGADGRGKLMAEGSAKLRDGAVKLQLDVASLKDFLAGKMTRTKADIYVPATHLSFSGDASNTDGLTASGKFEAGVLGVPTLVEWATAAPTKGTLPTNVAVRGALYVKGINHIALEEISAEVDDLATKGKLAVNLAGTVAAVEGNLDFDVLNLTPWMGTTPAEPVGDAPAADAGWSDAPLDFSALRSMQAQLVVKANAVRAGKLAWDATHIGIALKQGVMKLTLHAVALYGGNLKGDITLDGSKATSGVVADLAFADIQMEPLMESLSGSSRLKGTANLNLVLDGEGATQRALVASLAGKGNLNMKDGAVKGVNLAALMRNVQKGNLLFGKSEELATDFSTLSASWNVAKGVLSNKDFLLLAPALRVTGSGTATLPTRTLNYKLTPTLVTSADAKTGNTAGGLTVPLLLSGSWSNPAITPDVAGALREGLKNPETLKQSVKDISGAVKQLNSPQDLKRVLFGAPAPAEAPVAPAPAPATQEAPKN